MRIKKQEYHNWLTGEFDKEGWGILKDNTPERIRKMYEEHKEKVKKEKEQGYL